MKIDRYGTLITDEEYPGCVGDSCANTARQFILELFIPKELRSNLDLKIFRTERGYVRHPEAPSGPPVSKDDWREVSFTSDQALPLLMAYDLSEHPLYGSEMKKFCRFKTAPKKFSAPGVFSFCFGLNWLLFFFTVLQAFIFMIPYRWSDDNRMAGKWWKVEKSEGSSADYLNYVATAAWFHLKEMRLRAYFLVWLAGEEKCRLKISSYFRPEPNSNWIVKSFFTATDQIMR